MNATLKQAKKALDLIDQSGADAEQLQKIFPYLSDLLRANTAEMNRDDFQKMCGIKPKLTLLTFVGNTAILASRSTFVAREHFVINTSETASVKISGFGGCFEERLLNKVEQGLDARSTMRCHLLRKESLDAPVIDELGGLGQVQSFLAEIFALLMKQPDGQRGTLFNDGRKNMFYVCTSNTEPLSIRVSWHSGGWYIGADSIKDQDARMDTLDFGCQIFTPHYSFSK